MKVKTLIVGLGNPGKKYELTRHNVGFMVMDALCGDEFRFEKKFNAEICGFKEIDSRQSLSVDEIPASRLDSRLDSAKRAARLVAGMTKGGENDTEKGDNIVLMKPQTFMNLSGEAVKSFADYYKINPENIWVIHDDVDIPFGEIRIREGGSSAGHKGVESIIKHLGAQDFLRFRVGVKNELLKKVETEDFVLQRFSKDEEKKLPKIIDLCAEEIKETVKTGKKEPKTLKI